MIHEIVWKFDVDCVTQSISCHGGPESKCRWKSTCDCETFYGMEVDAAGPHHLAYDDETDSDVRHAMAYGGECNVKLFLEEGGDIVESAIAGTVFQIAATPVDVEWNGDFYTWAVAPS